MAFWNRKKLIPDNLPIGGKLSDYGGHTAAVQYRVWVETADGKRFVAVDPEFDGAMIAWRRFNTDLNYYTKIALPTAVVWDAGRNSYIEVTIDTMLPWLRLESPDWKAKAIEAAKEHRGEILAKKAAETLLAQQKAYLEQETLIKDEDMPEVEIKKKGKKRKRNPQIVHYLSPSGRSIYCTGRTSRWIWATSDPAKVTCQACLRRLYKKGQYHNPSLEWHQERDKLLREFKTSHPAGTIYGLGFQRGEIEENINSIYEMGGRRKANPRLPFELPGGDEWKRRRRNPYPPSVYIVVPITKKAKAWVEENVQVESWQWMPTEHGLGFGVGSEYYQNLIEGMVADGLIPGYDFNAVA